MQLGRRMLIGAAAALFAGPSRAAASPIGLWRTFDDHTGEPSGVVRVFEAGDVLKGRVESVRNPVDRGRICSRCTDDRRDQPIIGLEIIRDLRPEGDGWAGHVLDPQTGGIYSCTAHLADGGQELVLHGYLVLPLFGRSQTWQRVAKLGD